MGAPREELARARGSALAAQQLQQAQWESGHEGAPSAPFSQPLRVGQPLLLTQVSGTSGVSQAHPEQQQQEYDPPNLLLGNGPSRLAADPLGLGDDSLIDL